MEAITSDINVQTTRKSKREMTRVGVDAPWVGSVNEIIDLGHKKLDTYDVEDSENSRLHVVQVETKDVTKNWTLHTKIQQLIKALQWQVKIILLVEKMVSLEFSKQWVKARY